MKYLLGLLIAVFAATGCSQRLPETSVFLSDAKAEVMTPLPSGGVRYATSDGQLFDTDAAGKQSTAALAAVDASSVHGMTTNADATYLSYVPRGRSQLVVAQVLPSVRVVWESNAPAGRVVNAPLVFTPTGRLLVALGGPPPVANRIITLDPALTPSQQVNVISEGWATIGGVAYTAGGPLWVAGALNGGQSQLVRAGEGGPLGNAAKLAAGPPLGLTHFGDQEVVACEGDGSLRRFLLQNAAATPGRLVATDCSGPVIELADGRLAYISGDSVRVTAQ